MPYSFNQIKIFRLNWATLQKVHKFSKFSNATGLIQPPGIPKDIETPVGFKILFYCFFVYAHDTVKVN